MNIKRIVPDSLTCCNLLCGAGAVLCATKGEMAFAFVLIVCGAVFDFLDGMSARALKVSSPIGVELDSLADDITFGLAPAIMLYRYIQPNIGYWAAIVLLMAAFSALRLAKFNIDERQKSSFIGLATPANALFWASICCMPEQMLFNQWIAWVMVAMSLVSCYLMVSEIPFFSLKFHNMRWAENKDKYLFIGGVIILIGFTVLEAYRFGQWEFVLFAGAACILWYVIVNLLLLSKKSK